MQKPINMLMIAIAEAPAPSPAFSLSDDPSFFSILAESTSVWIVSAHISDSEADSLHAIESVFKCFGQVYSAEEECLLLKECLVVFLISTSA